MNIENLPVKNYNHQQLSFFQHEPGDTRRRIPRAFSFPWGSGNIVEEVTFRGKHHEPCIQLLEFSDGLEIFALNTIGMILSAAAVTRLNFNANDKYSD